MSGGLFTYALEHVKDRQEGMKLLVHECNAIGRMFDERQPERFAQLFHQGAVDKLWTQLDGVIRDAPVSHGANPPARLCVSLQANRMDAQAPCLRQGRNTGDSSPDDEVVCFRSKFAGCAHPGEITSLQTSGREASSREQCHTSAWSREHLRRVGNAYRRRELFQVAGQASALPRSLGQLALIGNPKSAPKLQAADGAAIRSKQDQGVKQMTPTPTRSVNVVGRITAWTTHHSGELWSSV